MSKDEFQSFEISKFGDIILRWTLEASNEDVLVVSYESPYGLLSNNKASLSIVHTDLLLLSRQALDIRVPICVEDTLGLAKVCENMLQWVSLNGVQRFNIPYPPTDLVEQYRNFFSVYVENRG